MTKASANVRWREQEGAPAHVINEFEQLRSSKVSLRLSRYAMDPHLPFLATSHTRYRESVNEQLEKRLKITEAEGQLPPYSCNVL